MGYPGRSPLSDAATSAEPSPAAMRETALRGRHRDLGARFVEFAGWEMPIRYGSLLEEHRAVRERAGVFDVSHMGESWISGPEAGAALSYALVSDPATLSAGQAEYSMLCAPDGGIVDDLIVYRAETDRFLVVANASNTDVVRSELTQRLVGFDAKIAAPTEDGALISIQGPRALEILQTLTKTTLSRIRYYWIAAATVAERRALIARTGYTGEDGFEIISKATDGQVIWDALMAAGEPYGAVAVGLGARDTLRLEAGMPLYGNELDRDTTPFEAGLGHVVKFDKRHDFVGRAALLHAQDHPKRRLIGLVILGRTIARHGDRVFIPGAAEPCGVVTSGGPSPTLGAPIAMASVEGDRPDPGTALQVEVRGERAEAEVVTLPFYRRTKEAQR